MASKPAREKILIRPHPDVEELLPTYLQKRKAELSILKESASKNDFATVATICHNVKGTAGSYGVDQLGILALEIEKAAKARDLDSLLKSLTKYEEILDAIELVGA